MTPESYRELLSELKACRSVIVQVIDVTDYRNSMINNLLDIVGHGHPVYIVANKIDLLPKDYKGYLQRIEKCIAEYAESVRKNWNISLNNSLSPSLENIHGRRLFTCMCYV